jgi:hypothetical protein
MEQPEEHWEYARTLAPDLDVEPAPPAGEGWERDPAVGCPDCAGCGFVLAGTGRRDIQAGSPLARPVLWLRGSRRSRPQLTVRVLITISPPEQGWDRVKDTYSNIGDPGAWTARVAELSALVEANDLAVSEPGTVSHYTHREHLAGSTIEGRGVRGLCGVYFVPTQDHESLPQCETCTARFSELPE